MGCYRSSQKAIWYNLPRWDRIGIFDIGLGVNCSICLLDVPKLNLDDNRAYRGDPLWNKIYLKDTYEERIKWPLYKVETKVAMHKWVDGFK